MSDTDSKGVYSAELIDNSPVSGGQWWIIALCSLMSMIDGFDLQLIAFAAPAIQADWKLEPAMLGPVFSAGLFGGMIGGFVVGPMTDRVGPQRVMIGCALIIGVTTMATVLARNVSELLFCRAITGVAIGAASPAIVSLLSAYSPRRLRATLVTVAFCTQLLGAFLGSIASAKLLETAGWHSIFILGGIAPLILVPAIVRFVPEPLELLVRRGAPAEKIQRALALINRPKQHLLADARIQADEGKGGSALALFRGGMGVASILLLLTALTGGTFFYFLASWLPTILHEQGATLQTAVYGSTALNLGGLIGSLLFARQIDRHGPYGIMSLGYVVSGLVLMAVVFGSMGMWWTIAVIGVASLFGLGAQYCIPAAIVLLYPHHVQGAATGFALGSARIGAVIGPLIGTFILLKGGGARDLFLFAAIMALIAGATVFLGYRHGKRAVR